MKFSFITINLTLLFCGLSLAAVPNQSFDTQTQKESYSIGYQVGLSMMTDEIVVDFASLTQGLQDAISGKTPPLSNKEMKSLIVDLKTKARESQMRKHQETLVKNAQESENFLLKNGHKDGVKTTPSGLQYQILKEGDSPSPTLENYVKVHYRGTFIDGTEFDSSLAKGDPQIFKIDGVIKGWKEALQMMRVGSKWRIYVPPNLAYGKGGLGGMIPGNKLLIFEMELISIEETHKPGKVS